MRRAVAIALVAAALVTPAEIAALVAAATVRPLLRSPLLRSPPNFSDGRRPCRRGDSRCPCLQSARAADGCPSARASTAGAPSAGGVASASTGAPSRGLRNSLWRRPRRWRCSRPGAAASPPSPAAAAGAAPSCAALRTVGHDDAGGCGHGADGALPNGRRAARLRPVQARPAHRAWPRRQRLRRRSVAGDGLGCVGNGASGCFGGSFRQRLQLQRLPQPALPPARLRRLRARLRPQRQALRPAPARAKLPAASRRRRGVAGDRLRRDVGSGFDGRICSSFSRRFRCCLRRAGSAAAPQSASAGAASATTGSVAATGFGGSGGRLSMR